MKKIEANSYRAYDFTKHANTRKNQRGFKQNDIEIILEWGRYSKTYNKTKVFLGIKECNQLEKELKNCLQRLDKIKGSTIIIDRHDGAIVTLYK